jgi:hypothetical protein
MSLIMGDYVSGFLGLSEGNAWNMNAFDVRPIAVIEITSYIGLSSFSTAYQNERRACSYQRSG